MPLCQPRHIPHITVIGGLLFRRCISFFSDILRTQVLIEHDPLTLRRIRFLSLAVQNSSLFIGCIRLRFTKIQRPGGQCAGGITRFFRGFPVETHHHRQNGRHLHRIFRCVNISRLLYLKSRFVDLLILRFIVGNIKIRHCKVVCRGFFSAP